MNRTQMTDSRSIDLFEYSLPANSVPFKLLIVITYDIHNARVNAKNVRSKSMETPSTSHIEFELGIKNLDIDLIQRRISHEEYLKKYDELIESNKFSGEDIENARKNHLSYVDEFVRLRFFLLTKN
jgi:hypothetical protein